MRAAVVPSFGPAEVLKIQQMEAPQPGRGAVTVRVKMAGLNFADVKTRAGKHGKKTPPFVTGIDCMGVVEETGPGVDHVQSGQRVIAFPLQGAHAEVVYVPGTLVFPIPDNISDEAAAACPIVSFTTYFLLHEVTRFQQGESILIHSAAGGVGLTAVQMAAAGGAELILGTSGSPEKHQAVYQAGAHYVLPRNDFHKDVLEHTNGRGVDVVIDGVGGATSEESLQCTAGYGRMAIFGNLSGSAANISSPDLVASCRSVLGFSFGTTRVQQPHRAKAAADFVIPMIAEKKLTFPIHAIKPLDAIPEAHEEMESGKIVGKILIDMER
ncbi:quinone oxidoreductase family protein [Alkalicoccus halolimnae]|uniref:Zinc-binding dehydrogenase n=1 Tax=Alkalicoccus halolimnae TaxID=1667239 RepID=A0A5C7F7W2_9BACI|nr:zinc-binding dehydrogenase [Alkalicoccus halolimnae]TXF85478.1 zinc-binding dehydrogenase [Alkalicoccus halolimnae]